jgi:hypothetical protein
MFLKNGESVIATQRAFRTHFELGRRDRILSPDLAPCDFFLWGHLKAEVHKHRPTGRAEHRDSRRNRGIPSDMTARVMNKFRKRLDVCIRSQGRHMDDTVFHKYWQI